MNDEAKKSVCEEIISIMQVYDEQDLEGRIDTPGGLEHMGDVWKLLRRWSNALQASEDTEAQKLAQRVLGIPGWAASWSDESTRTIVSAYLTLMAENEKVKDAARQPLFQTGDFTLHSGEKSKWIINCDTFSDAELDALALMAVEQLQPFHRVIGIPISGLRFAEALAKHTTLGSDSILIADDVLTTGSRMEKMWQDTCGIVQGVVIFARGPCKSWIVPICTLTEGRDRG